MVPMISWLPRYDYEKAIGDVIAGLTVGLMVIPQAMAYANLAGLPPVYGLYSSFMGVFTYAFLGTAKDVTVGPTALMSLIVSESFTALSKPPDGFDNPCSNIQSDKYCCKDGDDWMCTPVNLAVAATLLSGVYQILMGILNVGAIIDYIGFPVFNGFTTAAAITIFTSQIRHILGVSDIDRHWMFTVRDLIKRIHKTRYADVLMGLVCIGFTYFLERLKAKYNDRRNFGRKEYFFWLCGTARNAIVVAFALIVSRIIAATDAGDTIFKLVYDVPEGVPAVRDPLSQIDSTGLSEVLTASVTIALLGYLESIAIGKSFAQKNGYNLDPTQEMRAIGVASVISAFFQSYPITGSFSRTAVNSASNVHTPLGGFVTGLLVIISLELLTPAFYYIPKAALAAIIMMSVVHMVDVPQVRRIARVNSKDLIVWFTSFLACLLWSLEFGILLAVGVSFCLSLFTENQQALRKMARDDELGIWVPDLGRGSSTAGLPNDWAPLFTATEGKPLVLKIEGNVSFLMGNKFKDRFGAIARYFQSEQEVRAIILDMSAVTDMDYSGVMALESILAQLKPQLQNVAARGGEEVPVYGTDGLPLKCTDGNIQTVLKKAGEIIKRRVLGVRLHAAHISPKVHAVMKKAGLMDGSLGRGQWSIVAHPTIDLAIDCLAADFEIVMNVWPFEWMVPGTFPQFVEDGDAREGRAESPARLWRSTKMKSKSIWVRAQDEFKLTVI